MTTSTFQRRYELDWLRVSATLLVFLYHSTRFFNVGDWVVKNDNTFVWVELWNVFAMSWLMPLFFIISGASLFYAMKKTEGGKSDGGKSDGGKSDGGKSRGFKNFYVDKFLRLMVPVVVASVTASAVQVYLERLTHGQFTGSFFSFIPEYMNGLYKGIGVPGGNFAFHGTHLWYLLFLFIDCLICYRLFVWFKGSGEGILNGLTKVLAMPGWMYVWFSSPPLIMKATLPEYVLNIGAGSWGFLYYLWFLIAGFMIVSSDRLQKNITNQRWISLILGVVLSTAYLYQLFSPSRVMLPALIADLTQSFVYFVSAWCWLCAILGFGMRFLAFDRPSLRNANEGVLPFYILHQPVLVCVGFFVMSWEINDFLKWVIVLAISFLVILTLYIFLVRKFNLFRFLFGMKTTRPFYLGLGKKGALIAVPVLYIGLIVFAISGASVNHDPMPLTYDPARDILLDSESITSRSSIGVRVVKDEETSMGRAIEFSSGANQRAVPDPQVYVEMQFSAPAGRYVVWLRGKSDMDNGYTDSVWLQVDDQIGTGNRSVRLGNWLDVHPAGVYGWASDTDDPTAIELNHGGDHTIRIQPRQTPHRIDQIWLSRSQLRIPNTYEAIQ